MYINVFDSDILQCTLTLNVLKMATDAITPQIEGERGAGERESYHIICLLQITLVSLL